MRSPRCGKTAPRDDRKRGHGKSTTREYISSLVMLINNPVHYDTPKGLGQVLSGRFL
jgi:hypothetical protein